MSQVRLVGCAQQPEINDPLSGHPRPAVRGMRGGRTRKTKHNAGLACRIADRVTDATIGNGERVNANGVLKGPRFLD